MTEQEYTNLIEHLFKRLRELQLEDIVEEINARINRGKTVTPNNDADLKANNIKQNEVGKTQTLPLTSKEAVEIAIDHLAKVILEVPNYAKRITKIFGSNVRWESDQTQSIKALNTEANSFSIKEFTFEDTDQANKKIQEIKFLLNLK